MGPNILRPYLVFAGLACSILLQPGCGQFENKEVAANKDADELRGTWTGQCLAINDAYGKIVIKFLSETFTYKNTRYSDAACMKVTDVLKGSGTFAYIADKAEEEGSDATEKSASSKITGGLDYTFDELSWEFTTDPALAVDWAAHCNGRLKSDGLVDVLGRNCSIEGSALNFTAKQYGSFMIEDSKLYVTDLTTNGITSEGRAKAIDSTNGGMTKEEISEL